jgi:hypothetical protein
MRKHKAANSMHKCVTPVPAPPSAGKRARVRGACTGARPLTLTLSPIGMRERGPDSRRGSVLVIVLVVVVLLALAAYSYSQLMLTEMEASTMYASDAQARAMADSGAEYVATLLGNRSQLTTDGQSLQHNPQLFQGVLVADSSYARGRGRFSIISPVEQDVEARSIRYGLMDESSRINLNAVSKLITNEDQTVTEAQQRTLLMGLPGMTEDVADAILDWVDADENSREFGAEAEYYESTGLPYSCKNGPLETIDELLLVRGVTPELLYGEDANRNGLLDPNENDGERTPPLDNTDGILQLGWIAYFTVGSKESNLRADGTPKININNGNLQDLASQLLEEFDEPTVHFIIQYRLAGTPDGQDSLFASTEDESTQQTGVGNANQNTGSGNNQNNTGGSGNNGLIKGGSGNPAAAAGAAAGALLSPGGTVSIPVDGVIFDAKAGATVQFKSLWEMVDVVAAQAPQVGGGKTPEFTSPYKSTDGSVANSFPLLLDALTLTDDEAVEGRINLNQARPEVLSGVPFMTDQIVQGIVNAQQFANDPTSSASTAHETIYWLYEEKLVDLPTLRSLDRYLTGRGDVYRAQILGFFDGGGPVARAEAVIDGTQLPPRLVFYRDLNDLGRGYSRGQLLTPGFGAQ